MDHGNTNNSRDSDTHGYHRGTMTTVIAVLAQVAALFLTSAGAAKIRNPRSSAQALIGLGASPTLPVVGIARALAIGEVATGVLALVTGWRAATFAVGIWFLIFGGVVLAARLRNLPDCGCLGATPSRPDMAHVAMNVILGATGGAAGVLAAPPFSTTINEQILIGDPYTLMLVSCVSVLPAMAGPRSDIATILKRE